MRKRDKKKEEYVTLRLAMHTERLVASAAEAKLLTLSSDKKCCRHTQVTKLPVMRHSSFGAQPAPDMSNAGSVRRTTCCKKPGRVRAPSDPPRHRTK